MIYNKINTVEVMGEFDKLSGWTENNGTIHHYFVSLVEKSSYFAASRGIVSDLKISLAKDTNLDVIFTVVFRNISLFHFDLSISQLSGLAIEDISDRNLEKCNYEIYDYEQDTYHFFCESIEVIENPC